MEILITYKGGVAMKYLKWNNGDFLGVIGTPTDMTYSDGSTIHIGDVITELYSGGYRSKDLAFVTTMGVMGLCHMEFANGASDSWKIIKHKKFNEHSEIKLDTVSIHEASIHDIAVKCDTIEEKFEAIKLMQRLNSEKEDVVNFSKCLLCNYIMLNGTKETNAYSDYCSELKTKIIIDYLTFIKHFNDTKLEVEIKQIDNVVLRRVVKGDANFSCLDFNNYPLWTIDEFSSAKDAEDSIKVLQSIIYKINSPKLYLDSLGQDLHDGDEIEFIIKDNFDSGIIASKIITINGNLVINFNTMILPEEIDNTKLYVRKVVK
jgi:hypothetical protein